MRISALSLEYVRVKVTAREDGAPVDFSSDVVKMAFTAVGTAPVTGDWKTASVETDSTTNPDTYFVRALVGPTGGVVTLIAGTTYDVWVKVTDNPETPILFAGQVKAT